MGRAATGTGHAGGPGRDCRGNKRRFFAIKPCAVFQRYFRDHRVVIFSAREHVKQSTRILIFRTASQRRPTHGSLFHHGCTTAKSKRVAVPRIAQGLPTREHTVVIVPDAPGLFPSRRYLPIDTIHERPIQNHRFPGQCRVFRAGRTGELAAGLRWLDMITRKVKQA